MESLLQRPITFDEACDLRHLLFGNLTHTFDDAWTEQSFYFRTVPPYGFSQKKAGPCGVLAAVQAYVLYELYFGETHISNPQDLDKLKFTQKREALQLALSKILWKAGNENSVLFCLKQDDIVFNTFESSHILKRDGILEYLNILHFNCQQCLEDFLDSYISYQMKADTRDSCIIFLYSVLLSKGIKNIQKEMDDPGGHLIGEDGYCSQEIINLILTGKAVSNLFDGDLELNSGGSVTTIYYGIPKQSEIGLLSLSDYHDTYPVGKHYKEPIYPIWVIHGESHFTVLFAKSKDIFKTKDSFRLYHYDSIAKTHAETCYLIKPYENSSAPPKNNDLPVVEQCIYTRWPLASVMKLKKEVIS